jgi:sugar transferase (PEP-CTERM/EpsH1 system associated)
MHNPPLVAHVIFSLNTGGLENGLVNIINRTPANRYQHIIICITQAGDFAARITADNVKVIELNKREGHDLRFFYRLRRLLRELRPDIVHSRNLAALETQLLTIGLGGTRRVHGEHGREVGDLNGRNWKYLAFRRIMRLFVHNYIAVSKDLERWLIDLVHVNRDRVRQIYNGVDHGLFSPLSVKSLALLPTPWQQVDDILVVGTVGRLTPVKDQQNLLCAVAELRTSAPALFPRVRVMIVGDGPLRQQLADLIGELELEEIAWLAGDREDVPALLATMDLFVLPSLAEGISNTVLEAMATGLPVIATAVGGNIELVEQGFNGSLVPVGDNLALTAALRELLMNEETRITFGRNARQRVIKHFNWNSTVDAYLEVYDGLLQVPASRTMETTE